METQFQTLRMENIGIGTREAAIAPPLLQDGAVNLRVYSPSAANARLLTIGLF